MAHKGKNVLCGNWKMKLSAAAAKALALELGPLSRELRHSQIWVAPSFTAIPDVAAVVRGSALRLGAQNVYGALEGAFTGEVSVGMLKEFGCEFAIVGHSERRIIFGETNELAAERAAAVLKQGFTVIFCIGETAKERKENLTGEVLEAQLWALLTKISEADGSHLIVAYEPVWAIGSGVVAKVQEIAEAHMTIAAIWKKRFSSACPPILYGGSVTADNFAEIIRLDLVAGALIGGASLTFESMQKLARISEEAGSC